MRALNDEEVRKIQLNLLDIFVRRCNELGLKYALCAGSLLGAVRHQGFIPWDDDVDVMMPRADYDRLIAKGLASEAYWLRESRTDPSFGLPFGKLCDRSTMVDERRANYRNSGVCIDIFPVDRWVDGAIAGWCQMVAVLAVRKFIGARSLVRRQGMARSRRYLLEITASILGMVPARWAPSLLRRLARLGSKYGGKYAGVITWGYTERVPSTALFDAPRGQASFEGRIVSAPADSDRYLRALYGDYWTPPPPDAQVTHHVFNSYVLSGRRS